jgi:hypothetical protein
LWEAFLVHMNDFDRSLELELRQLLDPVVTSKPPARRGSKATDRPIVVLLQAAVEPIADTALEPVVVTVPVPVTVL